MDLFNKDYEQSFLQKRSYPFCLSISELIYFSIKYAFKSHRHIDERTGWALKMAERKQKSNPGQISIDRGVQKLLLRCRMEYILAEVTIQNLFVFFY